MYNIYFDEKGPQESFKTNHPKHGFKFSDLDKLKYGDDRMHNYLGVGIAIRKSCYEEVSTRIVQLEDEYRANRPQLKDKELKGANILKSNFEYGIQGMGEKSVDFYLNLLKIINEYEIIPCIYSVNKISLITSAKLRNWIISVANSFNKSNFPNGMIIPSAIKFDLTNFYAIEGSEEMISLLTNNESTVKEVLDQTKIEVNKFIDAHSSYERSFEEIGQYSFIVNLIDHYHDNDVDVYRAPVFDWNYAINLVKGWINEFELGNSYIYLDNGIPKNEFERLINNEVIPDQNSKNIPGIRIADYIAVLVGKLQQVVIDNFRYDHSQPWKLKYLDPNMFNLSKDQFKLASELFSLLDNHEGRSVVRMDTYLKDMGALMSYLAYISEWKDYDEFDNVSKEEHQVKENDKVLAILRVGLE
ncbi:hypothetical protein HCZ06_06795 [Limosilactobacillus fermentum]